MRSMERLTFADFARLALAELGDDAELGRNAGILFTWGSR
jgi:hypothetical protein